MIKHLLLALILVFTLAALTQGYTAGATLVYNVTTITYYPNVTVTNYLYIMNVTSFINSSFVNTSLTIVNLGYKVVYPPMYSAGNATAPPLFFYLSPSLLGKKVIWRGGAPLYLNESNSSGYLYWSVSPFLQGTKVYFYMFALRNGTVTWVKSEEVLPNGSPISITIYRLWLANYSGPVKLNLEGFTYLRSGINWGAVMNKVNSLLLIFGVAIAIPLGYYLHRKGYIK